jgi:serine/threonine protein kinase
LQANILIKEDWSACLADFGLSKVFSDDTLTTSTNRGGSLYWMAPELLEPSRFGLKFVRTPATDVYAFGCVCFEVTVFRVSALCSEIVQLYTGRPPFSSLPEPAALMRVLDGERPERQPGLPAMSDRLWQHVTEFWAQSPDTRPPTRFVVQKMVWPTPGPRDVSPLSSIQKAPSAPSTPVDPPRRIPISESFSFNVVYGAKDLNHPPDMSVLTIKKPEEDILFSFLDIADSDGRDSDEEDTPIMAAGTSRTASPSSPGSSLLSDTSENSDRNVLRSYSLSQMHPGQETPWPSSLDDRISTPLVKIQTAKPIRHRSQPIQSKWRQAKTLDVVLSSLSLHFLFGNSTDGFLDVVPSKAATAKVSGAARPSEIATGRVPLATDPHIIDQYRKKVLYDCMCTLCITIGRNTLTLTRQHRSRGSEREVWGF